jgi:hypothetical protein
MMMHGLMNIKKIFPLILYGKASLEVRGQFLFSSLFGP